ncbi:phage tail tape measure protein [Brevundimonas faecalis]|uniref:phage tail tape measure protein n=1 Tax=Brevundimonas faecalis TaxID=947378 RepID=UPI003621C846
MKNFVAALTLRFMDRVSQPARSAAAAIGSIEKAQKMGEAASKQWGGALDKLDGQLNRLASASLVTEGIGRAGEAMMRPLKAGTRLAMDYEEKLAAIGDTADMTSARLSRLDRAVMRASRLGRGPGKVADAAGIFAAGGLSDDVAARLLEPTTKLVIGARVGFTDAANAAMAFNQSLKVTPELMERAFDAAAYSGKQGRFELNDMAQYLPSVGAQAARRGLSGVSGVAEVTAALTVIRDQTGESSEAATNFRDLLMKMDTNETANNFGKFNVDVRRRLREEQAKGRSPLDAIMDITKEAQGKGAQLNQLFTDQQSQLGIAALIDGRKKFDDIREAAQKAGGTVQTSFERMKATDAEKLNAYGAGMERLGVAAGKILAPAVGAAATVLESVSNWMSRAGESGSFLAKAAVWAVAGLAGTAVAAGAVGNAVVGILGPLFIAKTMLGPGGLGGAAFKAGAAQVIGLFGRMRLAAIGFNLSMLANPIVLIGAAAVAAVVGVALVVRKYWEPIKAFFGGVGAALGEAFGPALSAIGSMLAPLKPMWDGFAGAVGKVAGWFGRLLQPVKSTDQSVTSAADAGRKFGRALAIAFQLSPVGLFIRGIRIAFNTIKAVMSWRPMDTLRSAWSGLSGFFGGLQAQFRGFGRMILQGLISGIRSMLGGVQNAVMNTASSAVTWFKNRLGIRSPSRVFMGLGGDTMAGLTLGLDRGGQTAVRRVAAIGAAVVGAMPVAGATLPAIAQPVASAMSAASAPAGPRSGGVHIETLTIHVSVQGGGDQATGRRIGRDIAAELRRRLHDEA